MHCNEILSLWEGELPIGEKAYASLFKYLSGNQEVLDLEHQFNRFTKPISLANVENAAVQRGSMGNVCITGKLNDFSNRTKAKEFLEEHGYTVTTGVSGKTKYLVCEDGSSSSKVNKAESLEIPIVSIEQLIGKY